MASKRHDDHDYKYLDDSITMSDCEESQDGVFGDSQAIDVEIIDDGIFEDECEQILRTPKLQPELQETQPVVTASNLSNNIEDKCVCIKVVDCDLYPWYYVKYKKQILKRIFFKHVENILKCHKVDINKLDVVNKLTEISTPLKSNIREESSVREGMRKTLLNTQSNSNVENKYVTSNNSKTTINDNSNTTRNTGTKSKVDMEKHKAKSHTKSIKIDFKKNQGLIGLKIKNNIVNDTEGQYNIMKEYKTTICKEYCAKTENKHLSKSYVKSVNKTLRNVGTIITPIFDETQTNIVCDTKKDQSKQNDENSNQLQVLKEYYKKVTNYKPMPKSKRIEMEKRQRILGKKNQTVKKHPNVDTEIQKINSLDSTSSSKHILNNDNKAKEATYPTAKNKVFTNKLLMREHNQDMGSTTSVKEVTMKSSVDSNVNTVIPPPKPYVAIETDKCTIVNPNCYKNGPFDEMAFKNKNSSVVSNMKDHYVTIKSRSKKIPVISETNNDSTVFTNQNIDNPSNSNINPSVKSTSVNNNNLASLVTPTNENQNTNKLSISCSAVVPNNSTVTSRKSHEVRKTSYDPEKVAASQSINSKRKQCVNILSPENIGSMGDYMKLTGITKASVQSNILYPQIPAKAQQDQFQSFGNTADSLKVKPNNKTKDEPIALSQQPTSKPQQVHFPIQTIVSGRHQNTKISTVTTGISGTTNRYINRPDFAASMPLIHQPPQVLKKNMLKQVRPTKQNVYHQPNYVLPLTLGRNLPMPMTNGNVYHIGRKYIDDNYTPQTIYTSENCQRMISNSYRPPGICDVHPCNVNYPYMYSLPPPPGAPPLPTFKNTISCNDNSVIGKNPYAFVKKINNVTLSIDNEIDKEKIPRNENTFDTAPVLSKKEMMEVLNKAQASVSPVKADLKLPIPNEQIKDKTNHFSCRRPGPLSKKVKFNDVVNKPLSNGYSPPILPIPSYENIFSEVQTHIPEKPTYKPNKIAKKLTACYNPNPKIYGKKIKTSDQGKECNSKKISLEEYKIRAKEMKKDKNNVCMYQS